MALPYLLFKKPGNKKDGIKQTCSLVSLYISATILATFTLVITEPLRFISDSEPEGYLSIEQVTDSLTVNQLMVLREPLQTPKANLLLNLNVAKERENGRVLVKKK